MSEHPTWIKWRRASINPTLRAIVHFTSGNVYFSDDDIVSYEMDYNAFDASSILCGALEPATATLIISDFEQQYNPILNNELAAGIQVDILLGLRDSTIASSGPLKVENGALQGAHGASIEISQSVITLAHSTDILAVLNGVLQTRRMYEPYGTFYTTNWTYHTDEHTVEIELINGINDILNLDNRDEVVLGGRTNYPIWDGDTGYNTHSILGNLLGTHAPLKGDGPALTVYEPYACYEERYIDCITNMCVASMALVYYDQNNELYVQPYYGEENASYTITITDDDAFEYDITQTAVAAYDHAEIDYFTPTLNSTTVVSLTEPQFSAGSNYFYFNEGRIFYVYAVVHANTGPDRITTTLCTTPADWTEQYAEFIGSSGYTYGGTLNIDAFVVGGPNTTLSLVGGSSAYSITDNIYIQSSTLANNILAKLTSFLAQPAAVIEVSIRGCPEIWIGTQVYINSTKYHIAHMYTVIGISFNYDGAVSTTYTLQYTLP